MLAEIHKLLLEVLEVLSGQARRGRVALRRFAVAPSAVANSGALRVNCQPRKRQSRLSPAAAIFRMYFMFRIPRFLLLMTATCQTEGLLQITEIGGNGLDLRPGQAVRDRSHDKGRVWFCRVLTPLFAPVCQLLDEIGIELPR